MARILHVQGSPRGAASVSNQLAQAFLDAHLRVHPEDELDLLDVWAEDLPTFGGEAANGKLKGMSGLPLPPEEQAAFDRVLVHIDRLKAADKVVVSSGMWNFGVPYRLKQWVDIVVQAGHTFGFEPTRGYYGLVTGRPVAILTATGGDYSDGPMAPLDMLSPFLEAVFGFMGFTDIHTIRASRTAYPPEVSGPSIADALDAARRAGAAF